jgi:hypothetical protein
MNTCKKNTSRQSLLVLTPHAPSAVRETTKGKTIKCAAKERETHWVKIISRVQVDQRLQQASAEFISKN